MTANRESGIRIRKGCYRSRKKEAADEGEAKVRPLTPFALCPRAFAIQVAVITKRDINFMPLGVMRDGSLTPSDH